MSDVFDAETCPFPLEFDFRSLSAVRDAITLVFHFPGFPLPHIFNQWGDREGVIC